ncbi:transglycosylase SLT domain-containing protein [Streptomyces sp. GC420]|uniref:transglycosylase SLT domain-containing protein n=1 Tax=Streptomyces sp. GC420 TaxID=2697568 RepID=UPI001414F00F|nr:transglycosylase SLT domain-containing protein [Streptomyces sp. GC420]NBM20098.1 transglycosylase SLT domain-containing protein [Streptomyces sp. GC420]
MPAPRIPGHSRLKNLKMTQKVSMAGVATMGAAAIALSTLPGGSGTEISQAGSAEAVAWSEATARAVTVPATIGEQQSAAVERAMAEVVKAEAEEAEQAADATRAAEEKKAAAAAKKLAEARKAAAVEAAAERTAGQTASRSAVRTVATATPVSYPNNLDGWIREALAVMQQHGIPGSYNGIYRNVMRESSGNPNAINNWDVNAANGTPSIGLLQIIKPTFDAYHVPGTAWSQYDPVANIAAACNYAFHRYGGIDNVYSAY